MDSRVFLKKSLVRDIFYFVVYNNYHKSFFGKRGVICVFGDYVGDVGSWSRYLCPFFVCHFKRQDPYILVDEKKTVKVDYQA